MLRGHLLHPEILEVLARAGHGSRIVIADGNFPSSSSLAPSARLISLNLSPGVVSGTQVLDAIAASTPLESVAVMDYHREGPYALDADPPIWGEYDSILRRHGYADGLQRIERFAFYAAAKQPDVVATIQTAEQRLYANVLLTVGVIMPE